MIINVFNMSTLHYPSVHLLLCFVSLIPTVADMFFSVPGVDIDSNKNDKINSFKLVTPKHIGNHSYVYFSLFFLRKIFC